MSAALRLWWLLRTTDSTPADRTTALCFGLLTWAVFSATGLAHRLLVGGHPATPVLWASAALLAALALIASIAVVTCPLATSRGHLTVLRTTGASRSQLGVLALLDLTAAAAPGVLVGFLAHAALCRLLCGLGADLPLTWAAAGVGATAVLVCALAVAATRVRTAEVSAPPAPAHRVGAPSAV